MKKSRFSIDVVNKTTEFIQACATDLPGQTMFYPGGQVSLYASCYAAMSLHYLSQLSKIPEGIRNNWLEYINSWQDERTGYYLGPEIAPAEFTRRDLDENYIKIHLLIHVLPSLAVLGGVPKYPLRFMQPFLSPKYLSDWLDQRNMDDPWYEGNLLLGIGQLLVYLHESENLLAAENALSIYFDWLDKRQDPKTGLWGPEKNFDPYTALYGSAHQLLVYRYCKRPINYAHKIIDTVLELQQADGSFSRTPGGGSCEDVDGVNTLVDLVKMTGYRISEVQSALQRSLEHILEQQTEQGGFVYRWGKSYMQSGALRTYTPSNQGEIFSTWYRLNTLALIAEVVEEPVLKSVDWNFNPKLSMGWHLTKTKMPGSITESAPQSSKLSNKHLQGSSNQILNVIVRFINKFIPATFLSRMLIAFARRFYEGLPPREALTHLTTLEALVDEIGNRKAEQYGGDLSLEYWWTLVYPFYVKHIKSGMHILHLDCGDGSLSYTLATHSQARIVATDHSVDNIQNANSLYHHPRLVFKVMDDLIDINFDTFVISSYQVSSINWDAWEPFFERFQPDTILMQFSPALTKWTHLVPTIDRIGEMDSMKQFLASSHIPEGWVVVDLELVRGMIFGKLRKETK